MNPQRIATPKTWAQLEKLAMNDGLVLMRTGYGVTAYTTGNMINSPMLTITTGDLVDDDADRVMRRSLEAGLVALKDLR
jgi:hypothetical protein